ncbi:YdeI/OmpD-associated family protein [Eisenibacter elegans]|jgi:uncharacterized protein YdeI (YjbR/CyaY-like superfamily)|uniref:YdeI/OmpD-associated family protein n=1 Tax=Eisenibacter elegans TaxID=997 RepID=UPI00041A0ED3|nr:YdeI/OmpD-associated family protein [Eisenibacter elegans]
MEAVFFKTPQAFRQWLEAHHEQETALVVGFYKVHTGKASMTWPESVDQALCFGWIDGVRKSIDADSYCIRFTPRKQNSIWSAVNIAKVEQLIEASLMTPAGLKAYSFRTADKSKVYAYETNPLELTTDFEAQFKKETAAWAFFSNQAPSYQRLIVHWVMSAKQEKTRQSRLDKVIVASKEQKRLQ